MARGVKHSMLVKILVLAGLVGCTSQMSESPDQTGRHGKVVLFDFYDNEVQLSIGEQIIFDGHLDVLPADASTGLSLTQEVSIVGCQKVSVLNDGAELGSKVICPEKGGFSIFINPNVDPKIKISYDPAIGLD